MGSSCGRRCERIIWRLNRISHSTKIRSFGVPEKGAPGVDSSMYRPYSGWKVGIVELCIDSNIQLSFYLCHLSSMCTYHPFGLSFSSPGSRVTLCNFNKISVCLKDNKADRFLSSNATTIYSIYLHQLSWSRVRGVVWEEADSPHHPIKALYPSDPSIDPMYGEIE